MVPHNCTKLIRWLFVTEEDIKSLPCFQNETLIAIKAPHGTTLEVPDPDEAVDYPQRRHRIILRSAMGPTDVYLVSQFEEKFEEVNGVEPSTSFPIASSSGSNENAATEMTPVVSSRVEFEPPARYSHRMSSDPNVSQDNAGGIMRIVPSDINFENEVDLSDSDDDFELLHEVGQRLLACNLAKDLPLFVKPLSTLPPALSDEDDDDDFEMCLAVVKRCAPYLQDKLKVEEDEGDAVNDEDEEDEQYDDRGKDKANSDEKSQKTKKRKKRESEKHYELDEDDYELLSDNNVKGFRRQKPMSKTFKRLKKAQRDTEREHSLFSGPSLEDIAEEEEQTEEEDDEMADFIVYEEEEDDKIPGRRKNLNKKCRRQQEFCATFGCSTLRQRESDNSTERSKKLKIDDVLEPIVLSRKYMTDKDILIRARDIPERQQISEEASGTPPTDEMSIYDECNWILNQLKTGMSATGKRELVIEKEHIQEFINLIRFQKLDIPFIATCWKLMYPSLFEVPDQHEVDSDYPSKADQKRGLTRHMVVWDIHDLDTEWLLLQLRKSALQSNKRFKEESCRVHDETYRTSTDQLFESITKSLKDAESEREVEDVELKFYLHFPEVGVGERKCKRLPNRGKKYKVCREAGLGAVADKFGFRLGQFGLQDELQYPKEAPEAVAIDFISTGFETSQAVLKGARHMAAVQICCEPCVRKNVRSIFMDKAVVSTCPTSKGHAAIDTFHQFAGVKWLRDKPLTSFEDAQWLLIQKAEEQKLLLVTVKLPDSVSDKLIADSCFYYLSDGAQLWNEQRKMIVQAAFVRFLLPSMEKEARSLLAGRAKNWLRNEYGKRLWDKVSVAPYKRKQNSEDAAPKVMACCWWPGERGTTFVMLNSFGELVDTLDAMYFSVSSYNFDDQHRKMNDVQLIMKFMTDHKPHVIVLGGVDLSCTWFKKDIDRIISLAVLDNPQVDIIYGDGDLPRLYENSRISVDQLPGHSGSVKRAVALGRVQLNPLAMIASLCGHDRDILFWKRSPLDSFLTDDEKYGMVEQVMVDVTSQVGLDVKLAIAHEWLFSPLQFISGLGPSKASSLQKSLVRSRSIGNCKDLLTAHGLGKKVSQNSIEFLSMRHTSFGCRRRQSQEDIFYMIPGVTEDTIAEGRILQATVKCVEHQRAYCEIELGLSRLTGVLNKKDKTCVWNKLHSGDTLTCRIKSIQFDTYQVSLTCVKNDILSDRYKNRRTMDPFYHENHSSLQSDREKDLKERETDKKPFLHRASSHLLFKNITLDEAMERLSEEEIGKFFFCPSPHGPLFLALILKVHDGVFAHKVIVEERKINDALSLIRMSKALRIGVSTFEDLDEIMDRYVDNYMKKFKLMLSCRKFIEGNQAKIDEVLRVEKSESPKKIVYCFGISFDVPGSFILTYIRSTIPHHEYVQVYPEGFEFRNKMFEDIVSLVNYVHSCIQSVVAGGSSGKTIYIGNLPSDISDEQLEEVLEQFGPIEKAGIQTTKRSDGFCFGFVKFVSYRAARSAVKAHKVTIGSNKACMNKKRPSNQGKWRRIGSNKACMKKKGPSNQGKWRRSSEGVPKWGWKHLRISDTAASLK